MQFLRNKLGILLLFGILCLSVFAMGCDTNNPLAKKKKQDTERVETPGQTNDACHNNSDEDGEDNEDCGNDGPGHNITDED